jgi:hypothetical protein
MSGLRRSGIMAKRFKVGDHVRWNSEAGRGRISGVAALMRDVTARFEETRELKRKLAAAAGAAPGQS